jgi:hypothetical protein
MDPLVNRSGVRGRRGRRGLYARWCPGPGRLDRSARGRCPIRLVARPPASLWAKRRGSEASARGASCRRHCRLILRRRGRPRFADLRRVVGAGLAAVPRASRTKRVKEMFITDASLGSDRAPRAIGADAPMRGFLENHPRGGLVHLAFDVDDLDATIWWRPTSARDRSPASSPSPSSSAHGRSSASRSRRGRSSPQSRRAARGSRGPRRGGRSTRRRAGRRR